MIRNAHPEILIFTYIFVSLIPFRGICCIIDLTKAKEVRRMRGKKIIKALRGYALPALVVALIAVFFLFARTRTQTDFPILRPENGVIDVRGVDFSDTVYHVVNSWDYYPGALYTPADFAAPDAPQKDNDAPLDDHLGTWRLRMIGEPDTYLSLCSFSIDYSTRIFVNGKEVRNVGFVSDDPQKAVPKVRYMTLPLYFGEDGEVEIVYQYANFVHNDGGFIQNTHLSTPENIDEYQRGLALNAMVVSGGLMMLFFYFLLCAAFQKNREYAALALCCLVIALRNQFFFAEHLLSPSYDFYIEYRLIVLDVSLIPMATVFLLAAFFPKAAPKWRVPVFAGLCAALSALHFVVDTHDLVLLCHICYYASIPFMVWFLVRLVLSFVKQKPNAFDIVTLVAILFFTAMLIREGIATGNHSSVNHFGVTPLAMVICILILDVVINTRLKTQAALLRQTQQRNELLGQVNEMNRDFLRTVAHELKTPLTVISGYAQLMGRQLERGTLSNHSPERLETIRQEADRLGEIVTRLMDYTYGRDRDPELTAVDIPELFESADAVLKPVCAKRGNTLRFTDDCRFRVHGNFELLLQVLINLVVNASRHTENGNITVETEDCGAAVAFRVRDNGEGIAPEIAPHIFEKGYTTTDGRGLGLVICSDTVALHGGTLKLETTGPEGSCFRFTIPKERET